MAAWRYRSGPIWLLLGSPRSTSNSIPNSQRAAYSFLNNGITATFATLPSKSRKTPKAKPIEASGGDLERALAASEAEPDQPTTQPNRPNQKARQKSPRSRSAWNSWLKDQFKELKASTSDKLDAKQITKELGAKWKDLPEAEKRPYLEAANANKLKSTGKLTSYSLFVRENFERVQARNPAIRPKEVLINMGHEWGGKSDVQKEAYRKRAEQHNQTLQ